MTKTLRRLLLCGMLGLLGLQPVTALAQSTSSDSTSSAETAAVTGTQTIGNDTIGYLVLPPGFHSEPRDEQLPNAVIYANDASQVYLRLNKVDASRYQEDKPAAYALMPLTTWIALQELAYRMSDPDLAYESGPGNFENLTNSYYIVSYKDDGALANLYFQDGKDDKQVYVLTYTGPSVDSLQDFGRIAESWTRQKP